MLNRRILFSAALAIIASAVPATAAPASTGGVRVDVSRLTAAGAGANASRIKAVMERELAGTLGQGLQGNGATLVVVVRSIRMASYTGSDSSRGGTNNDGMESDATILAADGRVIATYPIVSSSSAANAGPWYAQGVEGLRIDNLTRTNASWIKRYVAG